MYLEHFGLREAPFRVTPHTQFFFSGGNRGATLEALAYAITHDEGIVKVSGEVGSGKTMLCRALLERLPERVVTVYLANPSLSREEILFVIADGLGLQLPDGRTHQLVRALQGKLTRIRAEGKQVIVLIDEAHAMPDEALEEICRLSNLELNHRKLVQFVLVGQPDLDLKLLQPGMRQLKERVTHNFALEPMNGGDVAGYLAFRLRAAGYQGPEVFTPRAIQVIARAAEGLTRRINILADKALLAAAAQGKRQIDRREAQAAVHDARFGPLPGSGTPPRWLGIGSGGLLAALLATYYASHVAAPDETSPLPAAIAHTAPATAPAAMPPPPPSSPSSPDAPAAVPLPPDLARPLRPPPQLPAAPPPPAADNGSKAVAPASATTAALGPLTRARLEASQTWLRDTPGQRYFIQLMNTDLRHAGTVEAFLATHGDRLDSRQLRIYRSALSGRDRIGVIYGDFPTLEQATLAMNGLPDDVRQTQPFIRTVDKLR
ncbi:MAG TPA: AAA family ATPase [Azospira sp.]|nr:AAA family ATPase [Azospira sp.]